MTTNKPVKLTRQNPRTESQADPAPAQPELPPHLLRVLSALDQKGIPASQVNSEMWRTYCPLHDPDDLAHLDIRLGDRGQVLLQCRGGDFRKRKCSNTELLTALNLKPADLWPPRSEMEDDHDIGWQSVSRRHPCNVCGGEDWCSRSDDGRWEICHRQEESLDGRKGRKKDGSSGDYWVFRSSGRNPVELFPEGFDAKSLEAPGGSIFEPSQAGTGLFSARLSARHMADLRKSGLTDDAIRAGGFQTRAGYDVTDLLGWDRERGVTSLGPALVIPYRDASGKFTGYVRLKPDNPRTDENGKPVKYEAPVGQPNHAYFPAGTIPALKDKSTTLMICEGEKKACAADQAGFPCIGISGVWNWQKRRPVDPRGKQYGERELIDDLDLDWKDREVILAFDSDITSNESVAWAAFYLSEVLTARGAKVRAIRFPEAIPGHDGKVGIDDFLVAFGPEALRRLIEEADRVENPKYASPVHLTDLGNGKRLIKLHGQDMRYVHAWSQWVIWDGTRWKPDTGGHAMMRAKQTVIKMGHDATSRVHELQKELEGLTDEDPRTEQARAELAQAEALVSWAKTSESKARLDAMLALAQSEPGVSVTPDAFDTDHLVLNTLNGTVDLRTGQLCPHRRDDMLSQLAPVEYDPDAQAPVFMQFLHRIMADNEEMIGFLQRALGYAITGLTTEQCLFMMIGRGGNGKSTMLNVVQALLGDYAMQANAELLLVRKGEIHSTERADLYRKRLVACMEVDEGQRLSESIVKQLTGSDPVRARKMRQDQWQFWPTHTIFLSGNHKPVIRGSDRGIWRRVKLIPFVVDVPEEEKDPNLPDKLLRELPGILAWIVKGCLAWQTEGLKTPAEVDSATSQYREDQEADVNDFFREVCKVGKGLKEQARRLYQAFQIHADAHKIERRSQADFRALLEHLGYRRERSTKTGLIEYHGLAIKDEYKNAGQENA